MAAVQQHCNKKPDDENTIRHSWVQTLQPKITLLQGFSSPASRNSGL